MCRRFKLGESPKINRIQTAGEKSNQFQAENVTVQIGIDEKRAREISEEVATRVIKENTREASDSANIRKEKFDAIFQNRLREENGFSAFLDPGFQFALIEAYKKATSTDSETSYEMLAEILIERFKKKDNKASKGSIAKAIEAVDYISDDALLGLTAVHAFNVFVPDSPMIKKGLAVLDSLFGKLLNREPPSGMEWAEELDSYAAARLDNISRFKKAEEFYSQTLNGYFLKGIEKGSGEYKEFVQTLASVGLPESVFVEHELNPGFLRLPVANDEFIQKLTITKTITNKDGTRVSNFRELSDNERKAIEDIFKKMQKEKLDNNVVYEELRKYKNLKILREWLSSLNFHIAITPIGKVLAHTNARRIDKTLPPLE